MLKQTGRHFIFPNMSTPWRTVYFAAVLTISGAALGLLSLWIAANSYGTVDAQALFASYFQFPALIVLNLLPSVLLAFFGFFLVGRCYAGVLLSAALTLLLAAVNYLKILLRGTPVIASDAALIRTAGGIVSNYSPQLTRPIEMSIAIALALLAFCLLLTPRCRPSRKACTVGLLCCLILGDVLYSNVYSLESVYRKTDNHALLSPWSETEDSLSRGMMLPFLYSIQDALPSPPPKYNARHAQKTLTKYVSADIPEGQKVTVMGIMLEAFADLTDYPALAGIEDVAAVYAPLHELFERSVSGRLYTNIFAGGTVDSEWGALTGYSTHDDFKRTTDSYVWYFADQGYDTLYQHPGYSWFYDREHVNEYLGFAQSTFTDNGFGELVDPAAALFHSDGILYDYLLSQLDSRTAQDAPLFTFSVTYQNHGPYNTDMAISLMVDRESVDWSEKTYNILSNYLYGIGESIREMVRLTDELEARETPVVLFCFGDHKPWLGDDKYVYHELGIDFSIESLQQLSDVYATPYIIWANRAAKEALGADFTGSGGNFSPCYLMMRLFDECGWDGPSFLQLQRGMFDITPMMRPSHMFLKHGRLTNRLSQSEQEQYNRYLCAQYWREKEARR